MSAPNLIALPIFLPVIVYRRKILLFSPLLSSSLRRLAQLWCPWWRCGNGKSLNLRVDDNSVGDLQREGKGVVRCAFAGFWRNYHPFTVVFVSGMKMSSISPVKCKPLQCSFEKENRPANRAISFWKLLPWRIENVYRRFMSGPPSGSMISLLSLPRLVSTMCCLTYVSATKMNMPVIRQMGLEIDSRNCLFRGVGINNVRCPVQ